MVERDVKRRKKLIRPTAFRSAIWSNSLREYQIVLLPEFLRSSLRFHQIAAKWGQSEVA